MKKKALQHLFNVSGRRGGGYIPGRKVRAIVLSLANEGKEPLQSPAPFSFSGRRICAVSGQRWQQVFSRSRVLFIFHKPAFKLPHGVGAHASGRDPFTRPCRTASHRPIDAASATPTWPNGGPRLLGALSRPILQSRRRRDETS